MLKCIKCFQIIRNMLIDFLLIDLIDHSSSVWSHVIWFLQEALFN